MSRSIFGWDLPPGVTSDMINGEDMNPVCEDCGLLDEDAGGCPYDRDERFCHKISLITECSNCKKKLYRVQGLFKKEELAHGYELCFCCSEKCANELQDKLSKESEGVFKG